MAKIVGSNHAASCAQFLPYYLTKAFGVYAAQAVETLILYSRSSCVGPCPWTWTLLT